MSSAIDIGLPKFSQHTTKPPHHHVRTRHRHPPALTLCPSPHRHLFTSPPLALALVEFVLSNTPEAVREMHRETPFFIFIFSYFIFFFTYK